MNRKSFVQHALTTLPMTMAAVSLLAPVEIQAQPAPAAAAPATPATPATAPAGPVGSAASPSLAAGTSTVVDANASNPPSSEPAVQASTLPPTGAVAAAPIAATAPQAPLVPPEAPAPAEDPAKKINMAFWMRIAGVMQNPVHQDRLDRLSSNGNLEVHFSNRMRKWLQWTANFVGTYGAGSIDGAGRIALLDLIAQLEPHESFNFWAGRMLVPSDRANFAGPYFMAPWNYPGAFGAGPRQGPFGRNDGATIWGQFGGGVLKYYAGAYNLYGETRTNGQYTAPLFSGRLNLSLLNPEPGFYHNATYYGQNILAFGLGAQYQKNGTANTTALGGPNADYSMVNGDVLLELNVGTAGTVDVEGAFYKYFGDNETRNLSYFALASYLTPELAGVGRFQPLIRLQQTTYRDQGGTTPDAGTAVDAQLGYVIDKFATRFALGMQHAKDTAGNVGNQAYLGIQLMR